MVNYEKQFIKEIELLICAKGGNLQEVLSEEAYTYFVYLKDRASQEVEPVKRFTETGEKILNWLYENVRGSNQCFSAKKIGEGLFISTRSVSGSLRKLIIDGYVKKVGESPATYTLTSLGEKICDYKNL